MKESMSLYPPEITEVVVFFGIVGSSLTEEGSEELSEIYTLGKNCIKIEFEEGVIMVHVSPLEIKTFNKWESVTQHLPDDETVYDIDGDLYFNLNQTTKRVQRDGSFKIIKINNVIDVIDGVLVSFEDGEYNIIEPEKESIN